MSRLLGSAAESAARLTCRAWRAELNAARGQFQPLVLVPDRDRVPGAEYYMVVITHVAADRCTESFPDKVDAALVPAAGLEDSVWDLAADACGRYEPEYLAASAFRQHGRAIMPCYCPGWPTYDHYGQWNPLKYSRRVSPGEFGRACAPMGVTPAGSQLVLHELSSANNMHVFLSVRAAEIGVATTHDRVQL